MKSQQLPLFEKILDYVKINLSLSEPCTIAGINGMGKRYIFDFVSSEINSDNTQIHVVTDENYETYLKKENYEKTINLFHLTTSFDSTDFIKNIENIRINKGTRFTYVIFTKLKSIETALQENRKGVVRNIYFIKPLNHDESLLLLKNMEAKFGKKIEPKDINKIIKFSDGHIGLMKDLFLLNLQGIKINLNIINERSVINRIQKILNDLPTNTLENCLSFNLSNKDIDYLKDIGFISGNALTCPFLIEHYLKTNNLYSDIFTVFTETEKIIYLNLLKNRGKMVTREEIAKLMWGESWNSKYSDWAINQLIKRIRVKLALIPGSKPIMLKKSKGYFISK